MSNTSGLTPNWVVRNVPSDIWRSIFGLLLASMPLEGSERSQTLLHLTQICLPWRLVARDSPELWATIRIVISVKGDIFPNEDLLSQILRNARSIPLVMELEVKGPIKPEPCHLNPLKLFLQQAHRAKTLKLHCPMLKTLDDQDSRAFYDISMGLRKQTLPWLEELALDGEGASEVTPLLWTIWNNAPRLHSFSLDGPPVTQARLLGEVRFPFQRLSTLQVDADTSVDAVFLILSSATALVHAEFREIQGRAPERSNEIKLPLLQYLELGGSSDSDESSPPLTRVVKWITAPSLSTLHIHFDREWSLESFLKFLHNSKYKLKHLELDVIGLTEEDEITCLRLLPFLESFDFTPSEREIDEDDGPEDDDNFQGEHFMAALREFDTVTGKFVVCPKLRKMTVDYFKLFDPTTRIFSDMIEDRWRCFPTPADFEVKMANSGITELAHQPDEFPREMLRLLALQKAGMNITFDGESYLEELMYVKPLVT